VKPEIQMSQQSPLAQHHLDAHELGLHRDGYFHPACEICWDNAVDSYATECINILRDYGKDDDVLANFYTFFNTDVRFDRDQNGRTGIFLHDEPVYVVARFLGLKFQGDGVNTKSSKAFDRLNRIAADYRHHRPQPIKGDDT
jgi:hypothetical protein